MKMRNRIFDILAVLAFCGIILYAWIAFFTSI